MITISIGGKEIVVKPKHLLDYVEKVDFIKDHKPHVLYKVSFLPAAGDSVPFFWSCDDNIRRSQRQRIWSDIVKRAQIRAD